MIKNFTRLQVIVDEKESEIFFDSSMNFMQCKEVCIQTLKFIGIKEDEEKERLEKSKESEVKEEPKLS